MPYLLEETPGLLFEFSAKTGGREREVERTMEIHELICVWVCVERDALFMQEIMKLCLVSNSQVANGSDQ